MQEYKTYTVTVWNDDVEEVVYTIEAADAAHAARQGLDGFTGLVGNPDQSKCSVSVVAQ